MLVRFELDRMAAVVVAALLCAACGGDSRGAGPAPDNAELVKPKLPPPRAALPTTPSQVQWRVTAKGVGQIVLGAPVPEPADGFAETYETSYYSDAQPLEGFRFGDPPVVAYVNGGPFAKYGYDHVGGAVPAKVKQRAVGLAKAGKLTVDMILVTDPRPKTEHGIGVGDTYATFTQLNPSAAKPHHFPGLWEEPTCMLGEDTLYYFFDNCEALDRAKLLRIAVRRVEDGEEASPSSVAKNERGKPKPSKKSD